MSRTRYLLKNTTAFALFNIGTRLINFFLVPLYTSVLSTEQYGTADLIFTICSFAAPLMVLNIGEAIMRFSLDDNANINKIMSVGIGLAISSVFSGLILFEMASLYSPISGYRFYVYAYAVTYAMCDIVLCYLRGKELILQFSIGNIIRTLTIACFNILFLVGFSMRVEGYLLAYILSNIVTILYAFIVSRLIEVVKYLSFSKELFVKMAKYSLPFIPTTFMWWIINSSDRIMLTEMVSVSAAGIFAISSKIPSMISVISTTFNQAFSYSAIQEEKSVDREVFHNTVLDYLFAFVTLCGLLVLLVVKYFMSYYVAEEYYVAWSYTIPLIVGTCFLVFGTFFSVYYTVNKDSIGFLKSGTIGAVVNIGLNFTLIYLMGTIGAAIATLFSDLAVFLYRFFDTKKYIKLNVFSFKHIISICLIVFAGISAYFSNPIHIAICILAIVVCLILYRNNWKKMLNILVSKIGVK